MGLIDNICGSLFVCNSAPDSDEDMEDYKRQIERKIIIIETRIEDLRRDMHNELEESRKEIRDDIREFRTELRQDIRDLKQDVKDKFLDK